MNKTADRMFGELLRGRRVALRLSQVALAGRLKWPQAKLSRVEQGKRSVTLSEILAVAQVLRCSVNELFGALESQTVAGQEAQTAAPPEAALNPAFFAACEDERVLLAHLARHGVRFLGSLPHPVLATLPLEEMVLAALRYMHDPRLFEALPALLLKNAARTDWTKLLSAAYALGLQNRLGMVLAAALQLRGSVKNVDPSVWGAFQNAHDKLAERRLDREDVVGSLPRSAAAHALLRERTPVWLSAWHGLGCGDLESFRRHLPR